jgi:hypothetical protein
MNRLQKSTDKTGAWFTKLLVDHKYTDGNNIMVSVSIIAGWCKQENKIPIICMHESYRASWRVFK